MRMPPVSVEGYCVDDTAEAEISSHDRMLPHDESIEEYVQLSVVAAGAVLSRRIRVEMVAAPMGYPHSVLAPVYAAVRGELEPHRRDNPVIDFLLEAAEFWSDPEHRVLMRGEAWWTLPPFREQIKRWQDEAPFVMIFDEACKEVEKDSSIMRAMRQDFQAETSCDIE
jgi:hypothetical protein